MARDLHPEAIKGATEARRRKRCRPSVAWRLARVAYELDISRRTLERERSAGRFPQPDLHIGRALLWRPETIRAWVAGGGCA